MKRKSLTVIMLASLFLLGACGQSQKATSTSSTSKEKTSQTSSSTKSKAKSSSSSASVSSSETAEGAVASSSSTTEAANSANSNASSSVAAQEKTPTQTATKDVSNIASFVGTWANDRGESVTVNADGSVVVTMSDGNINNMALWYNQEYSGVGLYTVYAPGASAGSAGLLYIPAGVTNPHIGTTDAQDTLVIGQDVSADEHPYYRQ